MKIVHIFSSKTNKATEDIQNCQDAFQIKGNRFAIADGASDGGAYPEIWADMLVRHFCKNPNITNNNWQNWLKPIQEKWLIDVQEKIRINRKNNNPSWFYNHKKLIEKKQPAAATFIGVHLKENELNIAVVGDSCIFIWQDNNFVKSIPYTKSKDFDCFPEYFASFEKDNKFQPKFIQYPIQNEKEIYCVLATDAFAEWILANIEAKKNIFEILINISTQSQFEELIANARISETIKLKNDDIALIVVKILDAKNESDQITNDIIESEENIKKNIITETTNTDFPSNEIKGKPKIKNNQIEKKLKRLKMFLFVALFFCLLLGGSVIFLIVRDGNDTKKQVQFTETDYNKEENSKLEEQSQESLLPTIIDLPKGTIIYSANNNSILKTDTIIQIKVLEKIDSLNKFEMELFVHKDRVTQHSTCVSGEIEIQGKSNVRTAPNKTIFGELSHNVCFGEVQSDENSNWKKFRFVGFFKNQEQ